MDKNRSETIDEIRKYISDFTRDEENYYYIKEYDQYDRYAWVEAEKILELLKNTPATLEWDGDGLITLLPHKDFGFTFKLEIGFNLPWLASSTIYIDHYPDNRAWEQAYNSFIYLNNKYSDKVVLDDLKESFCKFELHDYGSDEGLFVQRLLRSKYPGFLIDRANKLLLKKLTGSSWFKVHLENDSLILSPEPGFGPPIIVYSDGAEFIIKICDDNKTIYKEYWIDQAFNKILDLLDAKITNGVIHRQSIFFKTKPHGSIHQLMGKLSNKDFRDSDEECFLELLLREGNVPEDWFQKLSPEYEGSGISYYKENFGDKLAKILLIIKVITFTILLIGFIGSIIIFFMFLFDKYEPVLTFWGFIGPLMTITYLIAVGLVALNIFEEQLREEDHDIGAVSHQIGWFIIASSCFPVGYPVGLLCLLINLYLARRFERELKGCIGDRIIYQAKDVFGYIPFGRIWIPTLLLGTIGAAYWYKLPFIYLWILS